MKNKLANPFLMAAIIINGMIFGTGIYQHLFGIPEMLESPQAMETAFKNDAGQATIFWIPLHGLFLVSLVGSLITNWRFSNRKKLLLITAGIYLYISIVSVWFARELFAFREISDLAEFRDRTQQWIALSWHRALLGFACTFFLLITLARPKPAPEVTAEKQ